jgi:hypothetical protein
MAQAKTWAAFYVHVSGVVAATLNRESGVVAGAAVAGAQRGGGGVRGGLAGSGAFEL